MDLELDPLRQAGGGGEAGEADGFLGIHRAAGVGEEQVFFGIDEIEDVRVGIGLAGEIGAAQGHGHDLGAGGGEGVAHRLVGREFPGAGEEAGRELAAGDDKGLGHPRRTLGKGAAHASGVWIGGKFQVLKFQVPRKAGKGRKADVRVGPGGSWGGLRASRGGCRA